MFGSSNGELGRWRGGGVSNLEAWWTPPGGRWTWTGGELPTACWDVCGGNCGMSRAAGCCPGSLVWSPPAG